MYSEIGMLWCKISMIIGKNQKINLIDTSIIVLAILGRACTGFKKITIMDLQLLAITLLISKCVYCIPCRISMYINY